MKTESKMEKIKKVIKAKDSRFWLMIFVTTSTLFILVLWAMNLRNIFPQSISFASDSQALGLDNVNKDMTSISDDFSIFLERLEKIEAESNLEKDKNSDIEKKEIDELKKIIEEKINNSEKDNLVNNDSLDINSTSSIPVLSQDLDNSEQEIRELKKRLEELENKLGQ